MTQINFPVIECSLALPWTKKIKELKKIEGFLDVKSKEAELKEELRSIVETDEIKNKIIEEFKKTFG